MGGAVESVHMGEMQTIDFLSHCGRYISCVKPQLLISLPGWSANLPEEMLDEMITVWPPGSSEIGMNSELQIRAHIFAVLSQCLCLDPAVMAALEAIEIGRAHV